MKQVLKSGGAAREFYISDLVTHVIATDNSFPQYSEAKDCDLTIVQVYTMYMFCLLVLEIQSRFVIIIFQNFKGKPLVLMHP